MSNFINKFRNFTQNNWNNELEVSLNNELIKNRKSLINDESKASAYFKDFFKLNSILIAKTSIEFNEQLNDLKSSLNEEYHGYWEQTALEIINIRNKGFLPEEIKMIKSIGKIEFNTIIKQTDKDTLYVPKIDIDRITSFEKEIKKINKLFKVQMFSNKKYNIANKMNKINKMEESKNITDLYNLTTKILIKEEKGFNETNLLNFIKKNENKLSNIFENYNSNIDSHRIIALLENDTSDVNIYDTMITGAKGMMKRVEDFDPYKNVANKKNNLEKTLISFDNNKLRESINQINLSKLTVLATDINSTEKYSNVLVECEGDKTQLIIDKNNFSKFLIENAEVSNYMVKNQLDINKYLKSRPRGFITTLFKEYFNKFKSEKNIIKESVDFKIDDVYIDKIDNKIIVLYYYDADIEGRKLEINLEKFADWLEQDPERYGYQHWLEKDSGDNDWYNFFGFMDSLYMKDKYNLLRDYIFTTRLITENKMLRETAEKEEYKDYNSWKENIATRSNNNYEVKRKDNNSLNSGAYNSKGKLLGEWIPNENKGIIFK